jgi:nucleoside-diphosphate-sugar epimerase
VEGGGPDPMHVLILGAAGMIGRKLAERLASRPVDGQAVPKMTLADVVLLPAGRGLGRNARGGR